MSSDKSKEYYRGVADSRRWENGELQGDDSLVVDNGRIRIEDVSEDYIQGLIDSGLIVR